MRYESPSSVILYENCNHAYKLKYIDHLKPEEGNKEALALGKGTHKVLQMFYPAVNINTTSPESDFLEAMKKTAQEHWDRSIDAKKRDEMNASLYLWLQFEIQRFKKYKQQGIVDRFLPIATEEDLKDHEKLYHAIIDKRSVGASGNIYALDYKTDKKLPSAKNFKGILSEMDFKYKAQAALNALVLKGQGIKLDNFYFQFVRYPDKLLSVPLTADLFMEVEGKIKEIRSAASFPKNMKSCFYCGLKIYCHSEKISIHCLGNEII